MSFSRVLLAKSGVIPAPSRAGDGFVAAVAPYVYVAEVDATITVDQLNGGSIVQGTTLTSDCVYTLPTAALMLAAWPEMDIGDTFSFMVTNAQVGAFKVIIAVGTGITAVGANNTLSVPAERSRLFTLTKTSSTAMTLT